MMERADLIDRVVLAGALPQLSLRQICPEDFNGLCPFIDIPLGRLGRVVPEWWEGVHIEVSVGRLWELMWGAGRIPELMLLEVRIPPLLSLAVEWRKGHGRGGGEGCH